jgi:hypothetical protein
MKFGSFKGRVVLVGEGGVIDVGRASDGRFSADVLAALAVWDDLKEWAATVPLVDRRGGGSVRAGRSRTESPAGLRHRAELPSSCG